MTPSLETLRKQIIARITEDTGAQTISQFFAQIEYTAYWCVRMLRPDEGISAVCPETYDDVLIRRAGLIEFHQVKTREESAGAWSTADFLAIFARQIAKALQTGIKPRFVFASNGPADSKTSFKRNGYGPLLRLKHLLELKQRQQQLTAEERALWGDFAHAIRPRLKTLLTQEGITQVLSDQQLTDLLECAVVDTDSTLVHFPNGIHRCSPDNLTALNEALIARFPGRDPFSFSKVERIYLRIIWLILNRIRLTHTMQGREIHLQELIDCQAEPIPVSASQNEFDSVPGESLLEKKAFLAGFDEPRRQLINAQKTKAELFSRTISTVSQGQLDSLILALLDCQISCREAVCESCTAGKCGERMIERLRPQLPQIAEEYFPDRPGMDQICFGLLWTLTGECRTYWHCHINGHTS